MSGPVVKASEIRTIKELRRQGMTCAAISVQTGRSPATVGRVCKGMRMSRTVGASPTLAAPYSLDLTAQTTPTPTLEDKRSPASPSLEDLAEIIKSNLTDRLKLKLVKNWSAEARG